MPKKGRRWVSYNHTNGQSQSSQNEETWRSYYSGLGIEYEKAHGEIPCVTSTDDNYRFIRRNLPGSWLFYVLIVRLITFNNPIREFRSFFKAIKGKYDFQPVRKNDVSTNHNAASEPDDLVTVIIPTLNRYEYLFQGLKDLELQEHQNFEVIIVDQSTPFDSEFYKQFDLNITLIHQEEKLLWRARNRAIELAKGNHILLFDDDSRVEPDWISEHLKCLQNFGSQISSGVSISKSGGNIPANYTVFRLSDQLDTGNVLIKREVFEDIGLFDEQFERQRMGDAEFGLRAYLAGFKNISNPLAKRIHLKVGHGGLRQMGSWDAFRPKTLFAPRPVPSVLYYVRRYFGNGAARFLILKSTPGSIIPFRFKGNKMLLILGSLMMVFLLPIVLIQIIRSWKMSSAMIREGSKVPKLE